MTIKYPLPIDYRAAADRGGPVDGGLFPSTNFKWLNSPVHPLLSDPNLRTAQFGAGKHMNRWQYIPQPIARQLAAGALRAQLVKEEDPGIGPFLQLGGTMLKGLLGSGGAVGGSDPGGGGFLGFLGNLLDSGGGNGSIGPWTNGNAVNGDPWLF